MKKTVKYLILASLSFLLVLYFLFVSSIIKLDWNYAHLNQCTLIKIHLIGLIIKLK